MYMQFNIFELYAPDHAAVEPDASILCAFILFLFFFLSNRCSLFKISALKAMTLSSWRKMRSKKTLQRQLENIGLDPGWEIDSCLGVIIHYSRNQT